MNVKMEPLRLLMLAASVCFMAAWTLPNHNQPWPTAYQEFAAFFACLLFLFALTLHSKIAIPISLLLLFFPTLIPPLQYGFKIIHFSGDAWIAAIYLAGFALMIVVGYNFAICEVYRKISAQFISGAFIAAALLSSWIALRQWLIISNSIWEVDIAIGARPYANLAQANNFATLLCLGLSGTLYFYQTAKIGRIAASLTCLILIFCLALTQSRTPWVTLIAVIGFWKWKASAQSYRLSTHHLIGWALVYFLFVSALPQISEYLVLPSTPILTRASSLERWNLWLQLWQAAWKCPIWGCGWNQISIAQVNVSLTHPLPLASDHSHNILLDLLLWNGVPLGTLMIMVIVAWLARLAWTAKSEEALFALICSGLIIGHGLLEYPLEYAYYLLPLGLLLGVAAAELPSRAQINFPRWALAAILIMGCALFSIYWKEYRTVEEDYRLLRFEIARIGSIKARQPAPDVLMISQLREKIRFFRTPITDTLSEGDLEKLSKIAYRYPSPITLHRYALALGLNGGYVEGYRHLLILRNLYGNDVYFQSMDSIYVESEHHPQLLIMLDQSKLSNVD
ncbi:PglL family O-oligosaccharyltransferase [Pseudomonas sp. 9Ag]|uniref:PglL family O-oligosaccharyltransferase n=1 Tax=Pseudomonas sp. 9Ag TaxID=2653167 RepID=UPI0012F193E7|nr:O-antigen ligase family protein [Pseudomonas sp. 9Ag]VXC28637.1 O-antigen ligase [Pseudomonas sp. 9Ag]